MGCVSIFFCARFSTTSLAIPAPHIGSSFATETRIATWRQSSRRSSPADDPSDPLPGVTTRRYRFDPQKLRDIKPWEELLADLSDGESNTACARMYIDTAAPAANLSFSTPGPAESVLLRRATEELGAGRPPNTNRAAEDVALALTHAATAARAIDGHVIRTAIAPELRLTTDFGAVREGHPVEPAVAIEKLVWLTSSELR